MAPDSAPVAWKINSEVVMLLGWAPAILMQFAHPLVASGVAQHSSFSGDPTSRLRRLWNTLDAMFGLTFGTEREARASADRINAIHDYVWGKLEEEVGIFPEGTEYSAHDPELLRWVHATLSDSLLRTYERFIGPLTEAEKDRYCMEAAQVVSLLVIPEGYLPGSYRELEAYMSRMLSNGEIAISDTARTLAYELLDSSPFPRISRPMFAFMHLTAVGLLRPEVRSAYGFEWDIHREALMRTSETVLKYALPVIPSLLRQWPAARTAYGRLARHGSSVRAG